MLSLSERNLSRSLTKDLAIIAFLLQKKGIFQQVFQPVPPKITLFEIFLSLSLSLILESHNLIFAKLTQSTLKIAWNACCLSV